MKISISTLHPISGHGGEERVTRLLRRALTAEGVETHVIEPLRPATHPFGDWSFAWGLARTTCTENAHRVIANSGAGAFIKHAYMIGYFHGTIAGFAAATRLAHATLGYWKMASLDAELERRAATRCRRLVAVSAAAAAEVAKYYGRQDVDIILNPVDLEEFNPLKPVIGLRTALGWEKRNVALFVGRPGVHKGFDRVLTALNRVPELHVIAVVPPGTFPSASHERLRWFHIPFELMGGVYHEADFLLFPSRWEGCSMTINEALASGLPIISTNTGHLSGELTEFDYARPFIVLGEEELFDAVSRMIDLTESNRRDLAEAGRSVAESLLSIDRWRSAWMGALM